MQALPLGGGISSGIYRVDLRSGSYCVKQALPQLKVAKEWMVPVERVFSEIDYLRTVGRIVPGHVPRVLGQDDATKSFIMEFLGPEFRNWKAQLLAGDVDPQIANQVGDVLGRIHSATAGRSDIADRFATDDNFHAIRLEPYLVETLARSIRNWRTSSSRWPTRTAPDPARARAWRRQPEEHPR